MVQLEIRPVSVRVRPRLPFEAGADSDSARNPSAVTEHLAQFIERNSVCSVPVAPDHRARRESALTIASSTAWSTPGGCWVVGACRSARLHATAWILALLLVFVLCETDGSVNFGWR